MELARKFFSVICLSRPGSPHRGCAGFLSRPGVAFFLFRVGRVLMRWVGGHPLGMRAVFRPGLMSLLGVATSSQGY